MNEFLWNDPEIKAPPINKYKICAKIIDVEQLSDIFLRTPIVLSKQQEMRVETEYLSRIVYRMSRKFRNDIGFQYTRKTLMALKKYLNTTISSDIIEFHKCIPKRFDPDGTYLPTKQMLQYILVRLQTLMKFMTRIIICCEDATRFYKDRISRGQSWNISLLTYANHCKIWSVCKTVLNESARLYSALLPYVNKFQLNGPTWLNENYVFPRNLEEWLCYDLDNELPKFIEVPSKTQVAFLDITEDDDVEFCGEYDLDCQIVDTPKICINESEQININQNIKITSRIKTSKKRKDFLNPELQIDIGETVSRSILIQDENKNKSDKTPLAIGTSQKKQNVGKGKSHKRRFETVDNDKNVNQPGSNQESTINETPKNIKTNKKAVTLGGKFVSDSSIIKNTVVQLTEQYEIPNRQCITRDKKHDLDCKNININNITSARDLVVCLRQEEEYRNSDIQKALSKNLGLMQWHAFKNKMQVYIKKLNVKGKSSDSKNTKQLLNRIKREWKNMN